MKTTTQHLLFFIFLTFLPHAILAQWEKVTDGRLPAKAFQASTTFNGEAMYIARATIDGGVHIGKTVQGWRFALIPYGNQERWVDQYEVYTGSGAWISEADGRIPKGAIQGGKEADGRSLYIARAVVGNELTVGKIQPGGSALIPWDGKENYVNQYEVLINSVTAIAAGGYEGLGKFRLFNNKVLRIDAANTGNGTPVILGEDQGNFNDFWRVQYLNNRYYKITSAANGKALTARQEDVDKNGCPIVLSDYQGGDNQQWDIIPVSTKRVALRSKASRAKKALDIDKTKTGNNGTPAQLYDYWQGLNQFWTIEKIPLNLPPDPTDLSPPQISWEVRNDRTGEIRWYANDRTIKAERFTDSYTVSCIIEDPGGLKEWYQTLYVSSNCYCGDLSTRRAGSRETPILKAIPQDTQGNAPIMLRQESKQIFAVNNCGRNCKTDVFLTPYLIIKNYAGLTTEAALYFEYKNY